MYLKRLRLRRERWEKAFDLVFISMCPAIADWESVEKVLSCAREHSLTNEILPYLKHPYKKPHNSEMIYLMQLLYLKGYAFHSLVTKEMKTMETSREASIREVLNWLNIYQYPVDSETRHIIESCLLNWKIQPCITLRNKDLLINSFATHVSCRGTRT